MRKLSIVIPAYNEEDGINKTIQNIPKKILQENYQLEIIVIDNNSIDKTAQVASSLGAIVISETKQGYGYAIKRGFQEAKGDIIIVLDADNQHPSDKIPNLINVFENNNLDFMTTNRLSELALFSFSNAMPFLNKLGNFCLSYFIKILYGINVEDSQSGMWLLKKNILPLLHLQSNDFALPQEIKIEAIYYNNLQWKEVEIGCIPRKTNAKKLDTLKDGAKNLIHLFFKRFNRDGLSLEFFRQIEMITFLKPKLKRR